MTEHVIIPDVNDVDRQSKGEDGMTPKQRLFVHHALAALQSGEKYWKKSSALAAGYAETNAHTAAYENLRNPVVSRAIAAELTPVAQGMKVDRSYVLLKAMANLEIAEAQQDHRAIGRYLEIIARHADVGAYLPDVKPDAGGRVSLPFDPDKLSIEEMTTMVELMRKAASGGPTG